MQAYERLELEWAKFNGLDPAGMVACSSGTAALHLALEALQLPQGSECLVPDFTMIACPRAVAMAGLVPVFVDCRDDLNLDCSLLRTFVNSGAKSRNTSAVMAVHIYGRTCDMDAVHAGADPRGLAVIEDLAEAHGVKPHPSTDAACWSFYLNKVIAGEEGGALWFRYPAHATWARQLRNHGFTDAHDFTHIPRGCNYRLANALALPILVSMRIAHAPCVLRDGTRCERGTIGRRRQIEQWYDVACPAEWRMPPRDVVWVADIRIPGMTREVQAKVVRTLNQAGIEARMSFKPMHLQEEFKTCKRIGGAMSEKMSQEVFYLPVNPSVTTEESVSLAFDIIRRTLRQS